MINIHTIRHYADIPEPNNVEVDEKCSYNVEVDELLYLPSVIITFKKRLLTTSIGKQFITCWQVYFIVRILK
jgi:hypothetical protein